MKYKVKKMRGKPEWYIIDISTGKSYGSSSIYEQDVVDLCNWLNKNQDDVKK